tara:strand:- start:703 stop:1140 length:438 start_codon:yes stop_codon:yes gene_type:complete
MFGFLIGGEVNDYAVQLKTFADIAIKKYAHLSQQDRADAIKQDFPGSGYVGSNQTNFVFDEIKEFQFSFDHSLIGKNAYCLTAFGSGKYAGFMLQIIDGKWNCSVSDGLAYNATGGAKKLAEIMEKKFDVRNMDKFLKKMKRRFQ